MILYIPSRYDNLKLESKNILSIRLAKSEKELDYLFVGPSYVYNGINPAIFDSAGKKSFNVGVATAGPCFNEIIIDDYIRSSESKPKNIYVSVSYTTFSDIASDAWDKFPIHRYLNYPLSNETMFFRYTTTRDYIKLLRNSFKNGLINLLGKKDDPSKNDVMKSIAELKGFSPTEDVYSYEKYVKEKKLFLPYLKSGYSYRKEKLFFDIVKKYKNYGIKVIVIEPPTFKLGQFFNEDFKMKYKEFKIKCAQSDIVLIDSKINLDSSCFKNLDHMNIKGANIYTNYLLKETIIN